MTTTQVRYWELKEAKRHNLATEGLTASQLQETQRHNIVTEGQEDTKIEESIRHNKATEMLTATQIQEQIRHNMASERLTASQIAEQARHNAAVETETARHNQAQEKIDTSRLVIDRTKLVNAIRETNHKISYDRAQYAVNKAVAETNMHLDGIHTYSQAASTIVSTAKSILGLDSSSVSAILKAVSFL